MILINKPISPIVGTEYEITFKDLADNNLYNEVVEFLNSAKNTASSLLGELTELDSLANDEKPVKLKLLTTQLVYIRLKGVDYPFRGHDTGLNLTEFPRVGQDTYFPLRTLPSVIQIKSVSNAVGCEVVSGGFKSPSYSFGGQTSGGAVRLKITTWSGHLALNSFQLVSQIQGTPFYTNIQVSTTSHETIGQHKYRDLRMSISIPGQGNMSLSSVVVPKIRFDYTIWDEATQTSSWASAEEYNCSFTWNSGLQTYVWRFNEPNNEDISYFEASAVYDNGSYPFDAETLIVLSDGSRTLRLRNSTEQDFFNNNTHTTNFLYSVQHWQNAYPLITGGENIYDKTDTIYFNSFGVSIDWIARKIGTNSQNLGDLCLHPSVNKWARWKSFRLAKLSGVTETDNHHLYHYTVPQAVGANETVLSQEWVYDRPEGGLSEPYRLLDFRNYLETAVVPIEIQFPASINVNGTGSSVKLVLKSVDPANMSFPSLGVYFGVMLKKGSARQYKTASSAMLLGGLEVSLAGCSLLTTGSSIEIYCFYTETAIPNFVTSTTAVLKSLNLENNISIKTISVA